MVDHLGKVCAMIKRIVIGFLLLCVPAQGYGQASFIINENILNESPGNLKQIQNQDPTIWCVDTQWAETNLDIQLLRGPHFYGEEGEQDSKNKIYFAFRNNESKELKFSKIKYSPPNPYTNASFGAILHWQSDILFDRSSAAERKTAEGIVIEEVDDAGWNAVGKIGAAFGMVTFAVGDSDGGFFHTARGETLDLKWNEVLSEYIVNPESPEHREVFLRTIGALATNDLWKRLRNNDLCKQGSIFLIADLNARENLDGVNFYVVDYITDLRRETDLPRIAETSRSAQEATESFIIYQASVGLALNF